MTDSELVVVRTFGTHIEADLAKSALDAAGIEVFVRADDAGGERPHLWTSQGVEVVVRAEDAAEAREILDVTAKDVSE